MDLVPGCLSALNNISVYSSKAIIFIIGFDRANKCYRILEIERPTLSTPDNLTIKQDETSYTATQLDSKIKHLNASYSNLEKMSENACSLFGFIKLLESYYIIIITKKRKVASIHGHFIYTITDTQMFPITYKARATADESKYKNILSSMDMSKGFYFSYTYDLSNTIQTNILEGRRKTLNLAVRDMFVWNCFALKPLTQPIEGLADGETHLWVVPVLHGFIKQQTFRLQPNNHVIKYTLIARRSRMFAGTRYLRRGVNSDGYVANEVESEQIFTTTSIYGIDRSYRSSSLVQMRGSIPLYWSNTSFLSPKPDIKLENTDPERNSTIMHFQDLIGRYGNRILLLNLIKQIEKKPKESLLGMSYLQTLNTLCIPDTSNPVQLTNIHPSFKNYSFSYKSENENSIPLTYCTYDFLNASHDTLFSDLEKINETLLPQIGFFVQAPKSDDKYVSFPLPSSEFNIIASPSDSLDNYGYGYGYSNLEHKGGANNKSDSLGSGYCHGLLQQGVLRVNCIDCLDRTNVAMFSFGKLAAAKQLKALGVELSTSGLSQLYTLMMNIWAEHGDAIAQQYAGSGAMHRIDAETDAFTGEKEFVLTGGAQNLLVAAKRYYSNMSTDFDRQQSIDITLGIFEPTKTKPNIWDVNLRLEDLRSGTKGRRGSDIRSFNLSQFSESEKAKILQGHATLMSENADLASSDLGTAKFVDTLEPEEQEAMWSQFVLKSSKQKSFFKPKIYLKVNPYIRTSYYDDAHQVSLSIARFEDMNLLDFDLIKLDNVSWNPFSVTKVNTYSSSSNDSNRLENNVNSSNNNNQQSFQSGRVEQDLFFGRTTRLPQEDAYTKYIELGNVPIFEPSSAIFDGASSSLDTFFKNPSNFNVFINAFKNSIFDNQNLNDSPNNSARNISVNFNDKRSSVVSNVPADSGGQVHRGNETVSSNSYTRPSSNLPEETTNEISSSHRSSLVSTSDANDPNSTNSDPFAGSAPSNHPRSSMNLPKSKGTKLGKWLFGSS